MSDFILNTANVKSSTNGNEISSTSSQTAIQKNEAQIAADKLTEFFNNNIAKYDVNKNGKMDNDEKEVVLFAMQQKVLSESQSLIIRANDAQKNSNLENKGSAHTLNHLNNRLDIKSKDMHLNKELLLMANTGNDEKNILSATLELEGGNREEVIDRVTRYCVSNDVIRNYALMHKLPLDKTGETLADKISRIDNMTDEDLKDMHTTKSELRQEALQNFYDTMESVGGKDYKTTKREATNAAGIVYFSNRYDITE